MSFSLSNVTLLKALNSFSRLSKQFDTSNLRLTTGLRVNQGADDPSGLVAASKFSQELAKLTGQTANAERISNQIETADGTLSEISSLITEIQTKVIAAADSTATAAEKAAYQESIDLAINSIDRLVNTTTFNGKRLLDGALGYTVSNVNTSDLSDVRISSSNRTADATITVVATSATQGTLTYSGGALADDLAFTITGPDGSSDFSFAAGTTKAAIASAVAAAANTTGVTASNTGAGDPLEFTTVEYGEAAAFSIEITQGAMTFDEGTTAASGTDATVTVNGAAAAVDGQEVIFNANGISGSFSLTDSFNQNGGTTSFVLAGGGGAGWQLHAAANGAINFGISSLSTAHLGSVNLGYLSSLKSGGANDIASGNLTAAGSIVSAAATLVARDQGRLGAVQKYSIDTTLNMLSAASTAMTAAKDSIMNIDYAAESANNSRLSTLMEIGAQVIAAVNSSRASILSLLR